MKIGHTHLCYQSKKNLNIYIVHISKTNKNVEIEIDKKYSKYNFMVIYL